MNKTMKMLMVTVLALMLAAALALPALAAWGTMYVNKSKVKVYEYDDTSSDVIKTYKGGKKITVDAVSPDGKWAQITVGDGLGFIQMEYLSENVPQSFCSHEWSKWTVDKEPTCTSKGYRYRYCNICGILDEQETKKLGHDWGKWKVTKEATCVKEGTRTRTCKVCGETEKEKFFDEHTYGSWSLTVEPTCTKEGKRVRTCKVCGEKQTQTLDKLPHEYEYEITTEATDHSSGIRARICKVCGHNGGEESFDPEGTLRRKDRGQEVHNLQQLLVDQGYLNQGGADGMFGGGTEKAVMQFQKDQGLNADGVAWPQTLKRLNHDFGPWTTVREMTRTQPGERMRVCKDCGYEQHETVEAGVVFEKGRRGDDVRALQQIIKQVGYDAGGFDGIYGRKLDAAMAGFADDYDMNVEEGRIRPGDMDAVMNAWLEKQADDKWMGEGSTDTGVNLALTVTQTDRPDDSGVANYSWSLTNIGSEKAMYNALLLSFGDNPDFRHGVMVMELNGVEMKPNAKNSVTGSFSADCDWGAGNLNFAALAVTDKDGKIWLSNDVDFENATTPAQKTIAPIDSFVDVGHLPDGVYPVSFNRGDLFSGTSGIYMNGVHIYTLDWYDIVDVNTLHVGDTVIVEGEEVPVLSLDTTNGIIVNDGQDARAFEFVSEDDSNGFYIRGFNDLPAYTDRGVTSLVLDEIATFSDSWELDKEPVLVGYNDIVDTMLSSENDYFVQYNTTVRIQNGKVVDIDRTYVP